jgi:anti-sigma regulatory factor (Ser/Thr protein kinase)
MIEFTAPTARIPQPHLKRGGFTILSTPTDKFPELVTIAKGPKKWNDMVGRKYLDIHKCSIAVDEFLALNVVAKVTKNAKKDLLDLGLEEYL